MFNLDKIKPLLNSPIDPEIIIQLSPGRELDAIIWKIIHGGEITLADCRFTNDDIQPHSGDPNVGHVRPPHYSTDLSDAWKFVDFILQPDNVYKGVIRKGLPMNTRFYYWFKTSDVVCEDTQIAAFSICNHGLAIYFGLDG